MTDLSEIFDRAKSQETEYLSANIVNLSFGDSRPAMQKMFDDAGRCGICTASLCICGSAPYEAEHL